MLLRLSRKRTRCRFPVCKYFLKLFLSFFIIAEMSLHETFPEFAVVGCLKMQQFVNDDIVPELRGRIGTCVSISSLPTQFRIRALNRSLILSFRFISPSRMLQEKTEQFIDNLRHLLSKPPSISSRNTFHKHSSSIPAKKKQPSPYRTDHTFSGNLCTIYHVCVHYVHYCALFQCTLTGHPPARKLYLNQFTGFWIYVCTFFKRTQAMRESRRNRSLLCPDISVHIKIIR